MIVIICLDLKMIMKITCIPLFIPFMPSPMPLCCMLFIPIIPCNVIMHITTTNKRNNDLHAGHRADMPLIAHHTLALQ